MMMMLGINLILLVFFSKTMVKLCCWEKNTGELQVNLQGNERGKEEDEARGVLVFLQVT